MSTRGAGTTTRNPTRFAAPDVDHDVHRGRFSEEGRRHEGRSLPEVQCNRGSHTRDDFSYQDGGSSVYLAVSMMTSGTPVDTYLCTSCGFWERYVADPEKLAQVAQKWPKVSG